MKNLLLESIKSGQENTANILIVDDTSSNLRLLSRLLQDEGYAARSALDGATAITIAEAKWPDLILLDIVMPEMDGYEVCQKLKASAITRDIPIIFLSTSEDIFDKQKAFQVGGTDYIPKSYQSEEVLIRIKHQLTIQSAKAEIVLLNKKLESRVQERTKELEVTNKKLQEEINQRRQAEDKMIRKALQDPLTGLSNRSALFGKLTQAIQQLKKQSNTKFAIFLIDCDSFKRIKNQYSFFEANQLLIAISNRLISCFPNSSYIARFEGDEFAILVHGIEELKKVIDLAEKAQKTLKLPFEIVDKKIAINSSIGILLLNNRYEKPETILQDVNLALQCSKRKQTYQIFHPELSTKSLTRSTIQDYQDETYLKDAISKQEFVVYYQPLISLKSGKILELEALVKWHHPIYGLIDAAEFISLLETTNLIIELGDLVILEACNHIKGWQQEHQLNVRVSVNLSKQQFYQPNIIQKIDQILDATGIEGKYLKLEILESIIAKNPYLAIKTIEKLQARQIEVVIDNLGHGYCHLNYIALTYLMNFPIKHYKVNLNISNKFESNPSINKGNWEENIHDMFELVIELCHQMNVKVIVKNIESEKQMEYVKSINCELGQGNLIAKPMPKESLEELLLWST